MANEKEANPRERIDKDEEREKLIASQRRLGAGWALLTLAVIGAAWYAYPILKGHTAALKQFANLPTVVGSVSDQLKQATAKIETQANDQQNLRDQVTRLSRNVQAKVETAAKQAEESSTELYERVRSQIDEKLKGVETRIGSLESSGEAQRMQLADLQRELVQTQGQVAQQADELTTLRELAARTGADHENQLANLKQNEASDRRDVDSIEHRLAVRRVDFEVTKNHNSELAEGISLDVTRTDVANRAVSGWMWLTADRRAIWLKGQNAQTPVIFYGYRDGKKRELVITDVTPGSVVGYLLLPGDQTLPTASPAE